MRSTAARYLYVTGGVSYSVGGAAAPPPSATPTSLFATPIFWQILNFSGLEMIMLTLSYTMVSVFKTSKTDFYRVCTKTIGQYHFCPTNFAKEAPPMLYVYLYTGL